MGPITQTSLNPPKINRNSKDDKLLILTKKVPQKRKETPKKGNHQPLTKREYIFSPRNPHAPGTVLSKRLLGKSKPPHHQAIVKSAGE